MHSEARHGLCQKIASQFATNNLFEGLHHRIPVSGCSARLYRTAAFEHWHGVFNEVQQRLDGNFVKACAP
jgi:hypothetical protein